jgi:hypothetical protein
MSGTRMARWAWLIIFVAIGLLIGMTNLFAPFHEFAHVATAARDGVEASVTGWNSSRLHGADFKALIAGWRWELILAFVIAIVFSFIGRRSNKGYWITGGAGLGYAIATWLRAFSSSDFNDTMYAMVNDLVKDKSQLPQLWDELHNIVMGRWGWWGGISLLVLIGILIGNSFKGKEAT